MKSLIKSYLIPIVVIAGIQSASAVDFDFYKLGRGGLDFLPTDGIAATGGDLTSSNVLGGIFDGDLTFTIGSLTAYATGTHNGSSAAVIQDAEAGWDNVRGDGAGLGVYQSKYGGSMHPNIDTSDDNVTSGETLTITFNQQVKLTAIGLSAEGHNTTNWFAGATFLLDGVSTALPTGSGIINLNETGSVFTFAFDDSRTGDQFYLASLTASAVPEGGATLALLGLSTLTLGALRKRLGKK
ncbi:MAG: hypothetical protein ABI680_09670 [Chthoniobacteraceae bacterium]